jgi:hypothetical protein
MVMCIATRASTNGLEVYMNARPHSWRATRVAKKDGERKKVVDGVVKVGGRVVKVEMQSLEGEYWVAQTC